MTCISYLAGLERESRRLVEDALAPGTMRAYKRFREDYLAFCSALGCKAHGPCSGWSVECWVASLSKQNLSLGSVMSRLAALKYYSTHSGTLTDCNSHKLKLMLRGLKRRSYGRENRKVAASPSHLRRLGQAAAVLGSQAALQFKTMVALAFFGFLRPSEYCVSASGHFLRRQDVRISKSSDYAYLRLNSFKHSKAPTNVKVTDGSRISLRPVALLRQYLASLPVGRKGDPLFDISCSEFRRTLSDVSRVAGIKSKLTPHCFRIGGATWASNEGWTESQIQAHGRWGSGAYKVYVRASYY